MGHRAKGCTQVPSPPITRFVSVSEAALALGAPGSTVRQWCKTGRLPAVKMGKAWRIPSSALDDLSVQAALA